MRRMLLSLALIGGLQAFAGGDNLPIGARHGGMGYSTITLSDLWSVYSNQAGLAGLTRPAVGIYYQQHWLAPELGMEGFAAAVPLGRGTIAATASRYGFDLYNETKAGLAYAMRFGEGLRVGIQMDYTGVRFGEGYGSAGIVTAEIGVQAKLTDHLWIGAHLYNPGQARIGGPYDEKSPTILRAGLGYTFSDKLIITAEAAKDIDRKESFRAGLEYHPNKVLYLRTGVSTGDVRGHAGLGLRLKQFDVNMAVAFRSQLGSTPMIDLTYNFK